MNVKKIVFEKLKNMTKNKFDLKSKILEIGIDSLDLVELITDVEDHFKIEISDQELESIQYVENVIDLIEKKVKK